MSFIPRITSFYRLPGLDTNSVSLIFVMIHTDEELGHVAEEFGRVVVVEEVEDGLW